MSTVRRPKITVARVAVAVALAATACLGAGHAVHAANPQGGNITVVGVFSPPFGTTVNSSTVNVIYECTAVAPAVDVQGSPIVSTTISQCYLSPVNATAVNASQPATVNPGPLNTLEGEATNITQLGYNLCWTASVEFRDTSTATTSGCASPFSTTLGGVGESSS